ncbi:hypothetical protein A2U01_0101689, partial [Trifolium medium]|nr:hypothetical protein [Trifolium medium]
SSWATFLSRQARGFRQLSPRVASYWKTFRPSVARPRQAKLGERV